MDWKRLGGDDASKAATLFDGGTGRHIYGDSQSYLQEFSSAAAGRTGSGLRPGMSVDAEAHVG